MGSDFLELASLGVIVHGYVIHISLESYWDAHQYRIVRWSQDAHHIRLPPRYSTCCRRRNGIWKPAELTSSQLGCLFKSIQKNWTNTSSVELVSRSLEILRNKCSSASALQINQVFGWCPSCCIIPFAFPSIYGLWYRPLLTSDKNSNGFANGRARPDYEQISAGWFWAKELKPTWDCHGFSSVFSDYAEGLGCICRRETHRKYLSI